MKLRVFRSGKGDCLLLTSKDKKRLLIDGGVRADFSASIAPELSKLKPPHIDVVYVSHIDDDHIGGVLQLMNDSVAWRVHDFQLKSNPKHKAPKVPRPPNVAALWHNAFTEQIGLNAGPIQAMLAQAANALASSGEAFSELAAQHEDLASSTQQAIELSRRVSAGELGIKVNGPSGGKLLLVRPRQKPFKLGSLQVHIIGPFDADLQKLREEWNTWLGRSKAKLKAIESAGKKIERELGNAAQALVDAQASRFLAFSDAVLSAQEALPPALANGAPKRLGARQRITTPNLASLMLLVEEGKTSVLLTGDGHSDDAYKGLKAARKLDKSGKLHVTVFKVLHHGAEFNITLDFCAKVTADHYIFCGNGFATNPEIDVVSALVDARLNGAGPKRPFKFWFSSNPADAGRYRPHMKKLDAKMKELKKRAPKLFSFEFMGPKAAVLDVL